jgi:transposase-like protein
LSAPTPTNAATTIPTTKPPCPHCGKPYRTLLQTGYGVDTTQGVKQGIPLTSTWRCMSCGRTYTATHTP